jgi:hypothetical protein
VRRRGCAPGRSAQDPRRIVVQRLGTPRRNARVRVG